MMPTLMLTVTVTGDGTVLEIVGGRPGDIPRIRLSLDKIVDMRERAIKHGLPVSERGPMTLP